MAEPKKKLTRSRRGKRKAGQKRILPSLSICPQCKTPRLNYTVCPICAFYKGKKVIIKKEEKKK